MLLAMMYMFWTAGTTDIPEIIDKVAQNPTLFTAEAQWWLWLAFFASEEVTNDVYVGNLENMHQNLKAGLGSVPGY